MNSLRVVPNVNEREDNEPIGAPSFALGELTKGKDYTCTTSYCRGATNDKQDLFKRLQRAANSVIEGKGVNTPKLTVDGYIGGDTTKAIRAISKAAPYEHYPNLSVIHYMADATMEQIAKSADRLTPELEWMGSIQEIDLEDQSGGGGTQPQPPVVVTRPPMYPTTSAGIWASINRLPTTTKVAIGVGVVAVVGFLVVSARKQGAAPAPITTAVSGARSRSRRCCPCR